MLFHRRQHAQITLDTSCVVIANILLDHLHKLVLAGEPSAVIAFPFQDAPEALHRAVVNAMRHPGVLSRVMRKYNSVTYEVGKAKAEQAAGMFGLAADQRADSCPSRVAKPLAKPLTGGWRSASYARSQQSAPCFSRSICSSDFMLM